MNLHKLRCWLFGHDDLLTYGIDEPRTMKLTCASCGRETAGWILDAPCPVPLRDRVVRFRQRLKRSA